jgi:hypothetical protein
MAAAAGAATGPVGKRRGDLIKPQLFSNFPTYVFFSRILG